MSIKLALAEHKAAVTGVAATFIAAATLATVVAFVAPTLSKEYASQATPIVTGEVSLVSTIDSTSGGAFSGQ